MNESTMIRHRELKAVSKLWGELDERSASHIDETLTHCLDQLAKLVGAAHAVWVGAAREPLTAPGDALQGWRPRAVHHLDPDPVHARMLAQIQGRLRANEVDPFSHAMISRAGATRAFLRTDLVTDESWNDSWIVRETMQPRGLGSRLMGVHAVSDSSESYITLDRASTDKPFTASERDLVYLFLSGCSGFHRRQLAARVHASPRLTPRERDVLSFLLTERSEREIAEELGLTPRTTHQHVVAILRKFHVRGRIGLMAHWLSDSGESEANR